MLSLRQLKCCVIVIVFSVYTRFQVVMGVMLRSVEEVVDDGLRVQRKDGQYGEQALVGTRPLGSQLVLIRGRPRRVL